MQQIPLGSASVVTPGYVRIVDGNGNSLADVSNGDPGNGAAHGNTLYVEAFLRGYNGATWDRIIAHGDGDALGAQAAGGVMAFARNLVYNGASWDRMRGGALGDGAPATGFPVALMYGFNGATFDRLRAVGGDNADGSSNAGGTGLLVSDSRAKVYNGATWDRMRGASALDAGLTAGVPTEHTTLVDNNSSTGAGVFTSVNAQSQLRSRSVSGVNAQQQIAFDLRNLHDTLAIHAATSAGTATLVIEASVDNVNWLTIDSIAAAATNIKQYTATTVGAGIALSPLAFRWVRITAGAAGAGNTTTLTVGAK